MDLTTGGCVKSHIRLFCLLARGVLRALPSDALTIDDGLFAVNARSRMLKMIPYRSTLGQVQTFPLRTHGC